MKRLLLLLPLCCWLSIAPASVLDSVMGVWNDTTQPDTNRLKAMQWMIGDSYIFSKPDSAIYYAQMQYELAEVKGQKKYMANALNMQGISFAIRGIHPKAINCYSQSVKIFEELGNKGGVATAILNMGNIYRQQDDKEKALEYYVKSLKLFEDLGHKSGLGAALINVGTIYVDKGELEKAMKYFTRSLKVKQEVGHKIGIATSLINIGEVSRRQGDFSKAMEYFENGLKIYKEIGSRNKVSEACVIISDAYIDEGQYYKALDYATKGLEIAQEMGSPGLTRDASKRLYDIYKHNGDMSNALKMHELYIDAKDSITNEENTKAILQLQYKYEYENKVAADSIKNAEMQKIKDAQLAVQQAKLKQEKMMRYGLLTISLLIIILMFILILNHRNFKKQQLEETEKLLSQLKLLKADNALRRITNPALQSEFELDREKVNSAAENKLNESDLKILTELCRQPTIANKDIAEQVYLSLEGVKSSFKKMYDLFDITASSRNKKLALAIRVMTLSESSNSK